MRFPYSRLTIVQMFGEVEICFTSVDKFKLFRTISDMVYQFCTDVGILILDNVCSHFGSRPQHLPSNHGAAGVVHVLQPPQTSSLASPTSRLRGACAWVVSLLFRP